MIIRSLVGEVSAREKRPRSLGQEAAQTEVGLQEEIKALQEELALQRIQRTREAPRAPGYYYCYFDVDYYYDDDDYYY